MAQEPKISHVLKYWTHVLFTCTCPFVQCKVILTVKLIFYLQMPWNISLAIQFKNIFLRLRYPAQLLQE